MRSPVLHRGPQNRLDLSQSLAPWARAMKKRGLAQGQPRKVLQEEYAVPARDRS